MSFHTVTARSVAHIKQIKPAGATAKLAQNSALSARREKAFASSVATPVLDHANLEQNKQSFRMSLAAGFKAGFEAAYRNCNKTKNVRLETYSSTTSRSRLRTRTESIRGHLSIHGPETDIIPTRRDRLFWIQFEVFEWRWWFFWW